MIDDPANNRLADEVERIQSSPTAPQRSGWSAVDNARDAQLKGLAQIDEALKRMGIPLIEPYQRPLSSRIKPP